MVAASLRRQLVEIKIMLYELLAVFPELVEN